MNTANDSIEQIIREYIAKDFLDGARADFDPDTSLLETGLIDSIGLFRLLAFLEERFRVRIPDEDLMAENFQTLGHIVRYIRGRVSA